MTCPACAASRKSIVDAYFEGTRTGFRNAVIARFEGDGQVAPFESPKFCLPHERMYTQIIADEIRASLGVDLEYAPRATPSNSEEQK